MSHFHSTRSTPDNNSGPAAPMEHHVVKRILASLLLATCAMNANAENLAPTVAITTPVVNATVVAPAAVTLTAEAADSDGTIAKVEFFSGAILVATVTQAPYTYVWNAVTPGSYAFTAKATDDLNLATASAVQTVTVAAPAGSAKAFFIFSDQINTAREITNSAGVKVWQADPEPFGANLPNENPAGQGAFVYNPRFPGQYYDRETGLHYNYYRDYDPQTGRYVQSDPIGLAGGINTYGYVLANPVSTTDPLGLAPKKYPKYRIRECTAPEASSCQNYCSPDTVNSCSVKQVEKILMVKDGQAILDYVDTPVSCVCNRPEGNFCERNPKTCVAGLCALVIGGIILAPAVTVPTLVIGGAAAH